MKHNVYGRHLSRTIQERTALFKNLIQSLILEERIKTTEAKAKAIKGLIDKIINKAKKSKDRLRVSEFVIKKEATEKLYSDLISRFKGRTSGYTRIVKLGRRQGDNSMQVVLSLVEEERKVNSKQGTGNSREKTTKKADKKV